MVLSARANVGVAVAGSVRVPRVCRNGLGRTVKTTQHLRERVCAHAADEPTVRSQAKGWPTGEATPDTVPAPPAAIETPEVPEVPTKLTPANFKTAAAAIAVGLIIRFVIPCPAELTLQAWSVLAIFVSTIIGLVLQPLPVGAWAFAGLTVTVATKTLPFATAFAAFRNEVIWLIVVSFYFARGFEKCGLGDRIANLFVKLMGKSTLGLAYGLTLAEGIIAPAMPSTSARAGGIFMPIIKSLSEAAGSYPGESSKKLGSFLVFTILHVSNFSSNLFLTAAAQNLLCMDLAAQAGAAVSSPWLTWFIAAAPPCILGMILTPLIMYKLDEPGQKETPDAPKAAAARLEAMGPMTLPQKVMASTLGGAVVLWMFGDLLGVSAVVAAMMGLTVLLTTGVLEWDDCLGYKPAWDTLTWFAVLIGLSNAMNELGVISFFASQIGSTLSAMNLGWGPLFGLLHVAFFYIHYLFASQTAHVGALFAAFLALMLGAGVPPMLAVLTLSFNSNMNGAMTHYASGQAAIFCGSNYPSIADVFKYGFVLAIMGWLCFGVVGMAWWKVLGYY